MLSADIRKSKYDHLFETSLESRQTRLDEIYHLVAEQGITAFYENMERFGIGEDFYLHEDEIKQIIRLGGSENIASEWEKHKRIRTYLEPILEEKSESRRLISHSDVLEKNGEPMKCLADAKFSSWEETINNRPALTFLPKSIEGLQNLVKWAALQNKRVRASGYRHSSSDVFSEDGEILVAMVDIHTVTKLPAANSGMDPDNELQGIHLVGEPFEKDSGMKVHCKIGAGTCNYHFQEWAHDPHGGNYQWALPLNVIMTEISFGGSNAMICHGAGIHNKTISDLVTEVEFVNVKGEIQTVNDKELIKAAAGCFGLLGIVTSLTLELDEMTYANLITAEKKWLALTVPPAKASELSSRLINQLSSENRTLLENQSALDEAFKQFADCCENNYYSEWFWFPMQDKCWVNTWKNDGDKAKSVRYPGKFSGAFQGASSYLAYLADSFLGDNTPSLVKKIQTKLMGSVAMLVQPDHEDIVCTMEDALHFRRGIQNFKTRMMEIQIPVPNVGDSEQPDWSVCQKAWWAVHEIFYSEENMKSFPMRTTLEMRIMGGTKDILMASQYGNERTCSIEILTPVAVNEKIWMRFMQEALDRWAALKDDQGRFLNIRPHWAKLFDGLFIRRDRSWMDEWNAEQKLNLGSYLNVEDDIVSVSMREYMKHIAYHKQIPLFLERIHAICKAGGYTFMDLQNRFSNPLLDELICNPARLILEEKGSLRQEARRPRFPFFRSNRSGRQDRPVDAPAARCCTIQ